MYTQRNKYRNRSTYVNIAVAAVMLLAIGVAGYFAKSYYDLRANPNKAAENEAKRLTEAVGKLYQLPADETPIAGKVKDKDKLKDQPFFKNARNGDDILIYQKARVAIIYRAAENKLINVGPVAIDASPQQSQTAATVKVLNAANKQGAASDAAKKVSEIAGLTVDPSVVDAKKKNLTKTVVVDVSGSKADLAQQIAEKVGGTVGSLPAGEDKPTADVAVFVGAL